MKQVQLLARQLGDLMQLTQELSANFGTVTKPSYQTENVVLLLILSHDQKAEIP